MTKIYVPVIIYLRIIQQKNRPCRRSKVLMFLKDFKLKQLVCGEITKCEGRSVYVGGIEVFAACGMVNAEAVLYQTLYLPFLTFAVAFGCHYHLVSPDGEIFAVAGDFVLSVFLRNSHIISRYIVFFVMIYGYRLLCVKLCNNKRTMPGIIEYDRL